MDFWKPIQVLTITLTCRLSVDSKLVLKGSKKNLSDGSEVLSFTCSSQNNAETPYAEFLVNDKSIASSTYNAEREECHFKHEEKNCGNVCKCNSDGRSHTWTFPLPSSSNITQYSCHMFINNNHRPEQANIIFNGTDFVNQKDDVDNLVSSTIPSKDSDDRIEAKPIPEQSIDPGIYSILITMLLLMICALVFYIYHHRKTCGKESQKGVVEKNISIQLEDHPLINITDTGITRRYTREIGVQFDEWVHKSLHSTTEKKESLTRPQSAPVRTQRSLHSEGRTLYRRQTKAKDKIDLKDKD